MASGIAGHADRSDRQCGERVQVRRLLDLSLQSGRLLLQVHLSATQLGPSLAQVLDEALIGVVHELQVPEKPLAPRLRFGDGLAQRSRAYFPLALGVGVHLAEAPGEEVAPVRAEHAEVLDPFKGAGPGRGSARERYAREASTRHSNRRWDLRCRATHTGPTGPVRR